MYDSPKRLERYIIYQNQQRPFEAILNPQLNRSTPTAYQGEILSYEYISITGDTKSGPVIFTLKNNKQYVDLNASVLRIRPKITNADGKALPDKDNASPAADTKVAFANNSLHSLFCDVKLFLDNKRIEGGD